MSKRNVRSCGYCDLPGILGKVVFVLKLVIPGLAAAVLFPTQSHRYCWTKEDVKSMIIGLSDFPVSEYVRQ
jgi:hypothetical protein